MPVFVQIAIIICSLLAMIKIYFFSDTTPYIETHNQSKQIQEEFESKIETNLQDRGIILLKSFGDHIVKIIVRDVLNYLY